MFGRHNRTMRVLRRGLTLAMVASLAALFACGDDDDGIGDELDDLADGDGGAEIVGLRIEALPPSPTCSEWDRLG